MDRPSRPSEPVEPNESVESRLNPAPPERKPNAEDTSQPETVEDRVAPEPIDAADERSGADADRPAVARPSEDTPASNQETSDRLSAGLREQMLKDPRFTRLGWGAESVVEERDREPVAVSELGQTEEAVTEEAVTEEAVTEEAVTEEAVTEEAVTEGRDVGRMHDESCSDSPGETAERNGDQGEEPVDVRPAFSIDTEVDGEPVKRRFDRWDPERLAMERPPKPEASEGHDDLPDDRSEGSDRRAEDERNAVAYIAANKDSRPWLAPAADCEPVVQSVYASIDQSDGHGHIRHGAMGSDELQARRVAFNEDPAQPDAEKRAEGVDGLDDAKQHYCGKDSTRVHDATGLAAVYVMAAEHPDVRAVLDSPFDENIQPRDIVVPIAELLGPDGHELCSGFTLKGWPESKAARKEWLQVKRAGGDLSEMAEPEVERIPTFEGGDIKIVFKRIPDAKRYGIYTLFPRPFEE